jgi:hypothetical protein
MVQTCRFSANTAGLKSQPFPASVPVVRFSVGPPKYTHTMIVPGVRLVNGFSFLRISAPLGSKDPIFTPQSESPAGVAPPARPAVVVGPQGEAAARHDGTPLCAVGRAATAISTLARTTATSHAPLSTPDRGGTSPNCPLQMSVAARAWQQESRKRSSVRPSPAG